jgi:hypothetical protein
VNKYLLIAVLITLMGCKPSYVKPPPPLIECDLALVPKVAVLTYGNAPELIVELYGYIEAEHDCLDKHRKDGDIR